MAITEIRSGPRRSSISGTDRSLSRPPCVKRRAQGYPVVRPELPRSLRPPARKAVASNSSASAGTTRGSSSTTRLAIASSCPATSSCPSSSNRRSVLEPVVDACSGGAFSNCRSAPTNTIPRTTISATPSMARIRCLATGHVVGHGRHDQARRQRYHDGRSCRIIRVERPENAGNAS